MLFATSVQHFLDPRLYIIEFYQSIHWHIPFGASILMLEPPPISSILFWIHKYLHKPYFSFFYQTTLNIRPCFVGQIIFNLFFSNFQVEQPWLLADALSSIESLWRGHGVDHQRSSWLSPTHSRWLPEMPQFVWGICCMYRFFVHDSTNVIPRQSPTCFIF